MHNTYKIKQNIIIYELVTSECKTDGAEGAIVYGVKAFRGDDEINVVEDISADEDRVNKLIDILRRTQVPPDQVLYIVEDYISSF